MFPFSYIIYSLIRCLISNTSSSWRLIRDFFFLIAVSRPKSRVINDLGMGEQVVICTLLECQQMAMKQRLAQILPVTDNQFCVTALGNTT